ncbi:MAG: MBG domain-containing protein, partial [Candidatus Cloacimonetes bacterium]|nr:MBG domain-containing protein [Candidatus Cloacimonadota bacterium]
EMGEQIYLTGNYFAIIFEIDDGNLFYMKNNPNQNISYPTYISQNPTSSWTVYGYTNPNGTDECVLPMMIQTKYDLNAMTYEVSGGTYTYDGQVHNPTVTVTDPSSYVVSYSQDGINYSTTLPNIKNVKITDGLVDIYTIYVKIEADFYDTVIEQVQIRINPKALIITPTPVTNVYGSAYIRPMCEYTGVISGESVNSTGILSVENFNTEGLNNVGQYNIIQNTLLLVSKNNFIVTNYAIVFISGVKYTITPKTIELVPDELTKNYGDADPTLTYHFIGVEDTQEANVVATLTRESGETVGTYAISLSGNILSYDDIDSGFYADNYEVAFTTDTYYFEIIPRVLTITPNEGQSKIYGEDDPVLTFTATNVVSGETPAYLGSLSRTIGEDAGSYQITLGSLEIVDNVAFLATNYSIDLSATTVYFKIYSGIISDSFVTDISDFYNGELHYISTTATSEYTVRYSEVTSKTDEFNEATASNENIGKVDCGVYYICFEFTKENYVSKFETAKLTISSINLTITPTENQSRIYGETDEILFGFSGNVANEIPAFTGNLSREVGENVGEYLILEGDLALQDGTSFLASNYSLIFDNGDNVTYEITKRTLTIKPDLSQRKFYGKTDPTLTFSSSNYVFSENADFTGLLSRASGEDVGEYLISIGSVALGDSLVQNYVLAFDETPVYFEITPVGILISIINLTDEYDNYLLNYYGEITFDTVSYVFEQGTEVNFVEGDDLDLAYLCYESDDILISNTTLAGNYYITAQSNNENYNVSIYGNSSYTITYRTYVVTFDIAESDITRTKNVTHFDTVGELPDGIAETPTLLGYTFKNWEKCIDVNNENWVTVENITAEI